LQSKMLLQFKKICSYHSWSELLHYSCKSNVQHSQA